VTVVLLIKDERYFIHNLHWGSERL